MKNCSGIIHVNLFKNSVVLGFRKVIEFPLTQEGIERALSEVTTAVRQGKRRLSIKPFRVPKPSEEDCELGYSVVPKWIIDELMSKNEAIKHFVGREGLIAVFKEMEKKGFLKYTETEGD